MHLSMVPAGFLLSQTLRDRMEPLSIPSALNCQQQALEEVERRLGAFSMGDGFTPEVTAAAQEDK